MQPPRTSRFATPAQDDPGRPPRTRGGAPVARDPADLVADRALAAQALARARLGGEPLAIAEALLAHGRHLTTFIEPEATWSGLREAARIFGANGLPGREAECGVAIAHALYDMGLERRAAATAHAALQAPALSAAGRVRAYVVLFNANGRMGRIEEAYAFLNDHALPIAKGTGDATLLAHVLRLKGWLFARLANSAQNESLPLPAYRVLGETPASSPLDRAIALLDEAQACLPPGSRWRSIEVDRQYALGLRRGADAARPVERLRDIAREVAAIDPPLAASAHFSRALLLHDASRFEAALAAIADAQPLAESFGLVNMARDLMFMRSICCEALGDLPRAFEALKIHSRMSLRSGASGDGVRVDWPDDPPEPGPATPLHQLRGLEPVHLKRALRWIQSRIGGVVRPEDVAQACGISRRTLDAAFRTGKGTTLAAYLKRRQFEHAADQLLHTNRAVRDVAAAIGYRSPTMFARVFREHLGLTPTQWREMRQADPPLPQAAAADD